MNLRHLTTTIAALPMLIVISGCSPTRVPPHNSINDFVSMSSKSNSKDSVSVIVESKTTDGILIPLNNEGKPADSHYGYIIDLKSTPEKIINEYLGNRFSKIDAKSKIKISITINSIDIIEYSPDSAGSQIMAGLGGGEITFKLETKIKSSVSIEKDGIKNEKNISTSADDTFVRGYSTGTSSSNIYQGENSIENKHGKNLNSATNKLLMQINSFLNDNSL